ncbi:hypothetical protein FB554_2253 [Barrientosiimonas humi]|uniref:Uncharacterized protein n=1 Tax=Barrientosiimonas humi TaxID=999931 RepID=A0A542XE43_9MICO|nr:hypothetical protein [Barrientosiimonas humi]TQL34095.1 hypothetical protein FB554_2253 [Barrientosiimonas humi]CAG7574085.1 hypothetical protein BH39T_PBIAJDOK_02728 [Barrientosiimonas humi]
MSGLHREFRSHAASLPQSDERRVDPRAFAEVAYRVLHDLDSMERDSTRMRISAVAHALGRAVNASGWRAIRDDTAGTRLELRFQARDAGPHHDDGIPVSSVVDGVGLHVLMSDAPAGTRARFQGTSVREVLLVGGYDPDAVAWAVEFYGDQWSADLLEVLPMAYTLVQAALRFPGGNRAGEFSDGLDEDESPQRLSLVVEADGEGQSR